MNVVVGGDKALGGGKGRVLGGKVSIYKEGGGKI